MLKNNTKVSIAVSKYVKMLFYTVYVTLSESVLRFQL